MKISSSLPPSIYINIKGETCIAAGDVQIIVPASTTLSDIIWEHNTAFLAERPLKHAIGSTDKTFTVPGKTYILTKSGRKVSCTCPGYTFRRTCKHIILMPS